jgi:hypothetical protein
MKQLARSRRSATLFDRAPANPVRIAASLRGKDLPGVTPAMTAQHRQFLNPACTAALFRKYNKRRAA